jgi:hypothetical protein
MDASLLIPSNVTVRGTPGKTILLKSTGVESALTEDADFGESYLFAANPERFHPGMGVEISDDTLKEGWDVSISKIVAVRDHMLQISPPTVRDYDLEKKHARIRNTYPIHHGEELRGSQLQRRRHLSANLRQRACPE